MITRSFELVDGKSNKFWTISLAGTRHTVNFGRRGTNGQSQEKDFANADEAQRAFDKLIAEKMKKGYVEVGATRPQANPTAAAPVALKREATTPSAPKAARVAAPPVTTGSILLQPANWMVATWRPRALAEKPQPLPFDQGAAIDVVKKWVDTYQKLHWQWKGFKLVTLPASMSQEEAKFWLNAFHAMTRFIYGEDSPAGSPMGYRERGRITPDACLKLVSEFDCSQALSPDSAAAILQTNRLSSLVLIPLFNLFSAPEAIATIAEVSTARQWSDFGDHCFYEKVLPFLPPEDYLSFCAAIRQKLIGCAWPSNKYENPAFVFRLAAMLGCGEELAALVENWPDDLFKEDWADHYHRPQEILFGLPTAAHVSMHMRRLKLRLKTPLHIHGWLAHTELSELDFIRDSIVTETNREDATALAESFCRIMATPEAAPTMLSLMLDSKAPRPCREWLTGHPSETIAGLASVVSGKGKLSDGAADMLRDLHRVGHGPDIESRLSPEALQKVVPRSETDQPMLTDAITPPGLAAALVEGSRVTAKLPFWASSDILPPIVTSAGRLNANQTATVLKTLAKTTVPLPHPLLLALRCYATPVSLDQFAWALFERWLTDSAPAKEKWALGAVGILGADQSAIELASLIREWPGQGKHQTAVLGLECLRSIGTDTALQLISGIAQKVKFQAIKQRAQECMEAIASDLGLTRPELEDRVVPVCGLDERGTRVFDFGPRQFRLVLGPGLKALLVDADNNRKPDLPKPNAKDDAEKAEAAVAAWKLMRKQLADVIKVQTRRLEQALVTQRRWTAAEFDRFFLRHPLMRNLSLSLVWGAFDPQGKLVLTFRITENRSLAGEHDSPVTLPVDVMVGLTHPMHLAPESLAAWGELLSDYEILPPFPQLGRPVLRLSETEIALDMIHRHADAKIPATALVGTLERLGWQRATPADAGGYDNHGKYFREAGITAIVEHENYFVGVPLTEADPTPINSSYFTPGPYDRDAWNDHRSNRIPLNKIDPLILSEVLSDLQTVASKGIE